MQFTCRPFSQMTSALIAVTSRLGPKTLEVPFKPLRPDGARMSEGSATKSKSTFRMECSVATRIAAPPERIWALLTNAKDFPRWNPTVTSIGGEIRAGERLVLKVPTAPERTFKPRVTTFEPARKMVWSDGAAPMFKGVRTWTLEPRTDGTTLFTMHEVFRGLMLPMIAKTLPDFGAVFEQYASALKREAEAK